VSALAELEFVDGIEQLRLTLPVVFPDKRPVVVALTSERAPGEVLGIQCTDGRGQRYLGLLVGAPKSFLDWFLQSPKEEPGPDKE
jgi:hypothetical protein